MTKPAKIHLLETDANGPELDFIPTKPPAIAEEVRGIARHLFKMCGSISESDRLQLMEIFRATERIASIEVQMAAAEGKDANLWLRLTAQRDKTAMLQRQLLRDMNLTRASTTSTSASRKATEKSGGKWAGVI
jgi:hypothetical protein